MAAVCRYLYGGNKPTDFSLESDLWAGFNEPYQFYSKDVESSYGSSQMSLFGVRMWLAVPALSDNA